MADILKIDAYIQALRVWAMNNNFTPHSLASAAGMSNGSLRDMLTDKWNPRLSTLRDLEAFIRRYTAEHQARQDQRPAG